MMQYKLKILNYKFILEMLRKQRLGVKSTGASTVGVLDQSSYIYTN